MIFPSPTNDPFANFKAERLKPKAERLTPRPLPPVLCAPCGEHAHFRTAQLCKPCHRKHSIATHPEKRRQGHARFRARRSGLTANEYHALVALPCAICGTTDVKRTIDHDHVSGQVRAALCHPCNLGVAAIERLSLDWVHQAFPSLSVHAR